MEYYEILWIFFFLKDLKKTYQIFCGYVRELNFLKNTQK